MGHFEYEPWLFYRSRRVIYTTMNENSTSLLGKLIWLRNKSEQGYADAKNKDYSHHAHLRDAHKALRLGLTQMWNVILILVAVVVIVALVYSPFGAWPTMQYALMHNDGIMLHILVAIAAAAVGAIGMSRHQHIGTLGRVAVFLATEYFRVDRWMVNGHTRKVCLEYLRDLAFSDDTDLYCKWQRHLYESLVSFAREIHKDEKKFKGSSRGFLERAFVNQIKVGTYFGLGGVPELRRDVFCVAQGTRSSRYLAED